MTKDKEKASDPSPEKGPDFSGLSFHSQLQAASEAKVGYLKVLTYGSSGAGKTSLLSTMPDPLLVLLTEKQGETTVRRVNPKAQILFIEDKFIDGKTIKAEAYLNSILDELTYKKHPFVSLALDSLTDMQQILLWDQKGGKPGADVSLKEWGRLIDRTKHLVIRLRNMNMHVGTICLADEVQDNNQRMIYRPALAGKKLPGNLIQYFNLCCFQRKSRDASAVGGATYESVFDAGDEYYTKNHPALDPVEVPNVRIWIDKIDKYAAAHGEGDMPRESSPVTTAMPSVREEDALLARQNRTPRIKELFDKLKYPEAKRIQGLRKFRDDKKLIEVLEERVAEEGKQAQGQGNGTGKEADKPAPAAGEQPSAEGGR